MLVAGAEVPAQNPSSVREALKFNFELKLELELKFDEQEEVVGVDGGSVVATMGMVNLMVRRSMLTAGSILTFRVCLLACKIDSKYANALALNTGESMDIVSFGEDGEELRDTSGSELPPLPSKGGGVGLITMADEA